MQLGNVVVKENERHQINEKIKDRTLSGANVIETSVF